MSFTINCSAKSRRPQCDQDRKFNPATVVIKPSENVVENLNVYVGINGSDTNEGTLNNPVQTVQRGLEIVRENGYNNTATVWLINEQNNAITNFNEGNSPIISFIPPFSGRQAFPITIRSLNRLSAGTATISASSTGTPALNYNYRFTVDSTANMRPGYALEWEDGGVTYLLTIAFVVDATTVEVCSSVANGNFIPANGTELNITYPGARIVLEENALFLGTGNRVTLADVVISKVTTLADNNRLDINSLITTTRNCIFENTSETQFLVSVSGSADFGVNSSVGVEALGVEYNSSAIFLGYDFQTDGPSNNTQGFVIFENGTATVELPNSLFDNSFIRVTFTSFSINSGIFRRVPQRNLVTSGSSLLLRQCHFVNPTNTSINPGNLNNNSIIFVDNSLLEIRETLMDLTDVVVEYDTSGIDTGGSSRIILTNMVLNMGTNSGSAISIDAQDTCAYRISEGVNGFLSGTYSITNDDDNSPLLDISDSSNFSIETDSNTSVNFTNTGTAEAAVLTRNCNLSVDAFASAPLTFSTAGTIGLTAIGNSTLFLDRTFVNGSTSEIVLQRSSKATTNQVTLNGAGNVVVGYQAAAAPPASGSSVIDIAAVPTGAGDLSQYINL